MATILLGDILDYNRFREDTTGSRFVFFPTSEGPQLLARGGPLGLLRRIRIPAKLYFIDQRRQLYAICEECQFIVRRLPPYWEAYFQRGNLDVAFAGASGAAIAAGAGINGAAILAGNAGAAVAPNAVTSNCRPGLEPLPGRDELEVLTSDQVQFGEFGALANRGFPIPTPYNPPGGFAGGFGAGPGAGGSVGYTSFSENVNVRENNFQGGFRNGY